MRYHVKYEYDDDPEGNHENVRTWDLLPKWAKDVIPPDATVDLKLTIELEKITIKSME
jgi:hypothetical protein